MPAVRNRKAAGDKESSSATTTSSSKSTSPKQPVVSTGRLRVLLALSVVSLCTASYQTYEHYVPSEHSWCDFSERASCSAVTHSSFSTIFNIPLALLGMLFEGFYTALALRMLLLSAPLEHLSLLHHLNVFGAVFASWLIAVEIYLWAICPFCTIVHVCLFAKVLVGRALSTGGRRRLYGMFETLRHMHKWILVGITFFIGLLVLCNTFVVSSDESGIVDFQCLVRRNVRMYGSEQCVACQRQKSLFTSPDPAHEVTIADLPFFVECKENDECKQRGIKALPTWLRLDETGEKELKRHKGIMTVSELRHFAGCFAGKPKSADDAPNDN